MVKLSKKRKAEILQERFPEFYKLSRELNDALDCLMDDMQEKIDKMEDIESLQEELEDKKSQLDL